jgi:hypothetical protein
VRFELESLKLEAALKAVEAKFEALRVAYAGKQAPSDQRCEQDIWIPWIAKQSPVSESFFSLGSILSNKVLKNHFVDIGLATRGTRGGRLNADIEEPHTQWVKDERYSTMTVWSPEQQLHGGAAAAAPDIPAYWKDVFLPG